MPNRRTDNSGGRGGGGGGGAGGTLQPGVRLNDFFDAPIVGRNWQVDRRSEESDSELLALKL
jgi:hypothetical protein